MHFYFFDQCLFNFQEEKKELFSSRLIIDVICVYACRCSSLDEDVRYHREKKRKFFSSDLMFILYVRSFVLVVSLTLALMLTD